MKMKKIIAILLVLLLVAVPVGVASAYTDTEAQPAQSTFNPRLVAPQTNNKYYYSDINIFYKYNLGMPNCTAYAWGRAYEILGSEPKLSIGGAHRWWGYNLDTASYPYGTTPKLGAIACWEYSGGGHVAVVEQVTDKNFTLSHSAYGGPNFYTTTYDIDAPNGGSKNQNWTFKGYIYILDNAVEGDPVAKPEGDLYRVNSDNGIKLRSGAGTSYPMLAAIPDKAEFYVTEAVRADGYVWGKTSYDGKVGWCVLDFAKLIEDDPNYDTTVENVPSTRPDDFADLNGDGKTTISDATVLQKHLASISVNINLKKADTNSDGKLSISDVTYIQKAVAGLV